uniref:Uncharacterized protein n=1 Tax=Zea mays TaxID=4577 RepID=C4J3D6_MAIZE|nr:unknown [Zea mays]
MSHFDPVLLTTRAQDRIYHGGIPCSIKRPRCGALTG